MATVFAKTHKASCLCFYKIAGFFVRKKPFQLVKEKTRFVYSAIFASIQSQTITKPWYVGGVSLLVSFLNFTKQENKSEQTPDSKIIDYLKRGVLEQTRGSYDIAGSIYHEALYEAQKQKPKMTQIQYLQAVSYIYDRLANLALIEGKFDVADALFKETMKGCLLLGMKRNDNAIIEISLKMAAIYGKQGKKIECQAGFSFCQHSLETKIQDGDSDTDTHLLYAMVLESEARYLTDQQEFSAAIANYEKAIKISQDHLEKGHPQRAVLMNDLATVYNLMEDYQKSCALLFEAVNYALENNLADLATYHYNLAEVYFKLKQHDKASQTLKLAVKEAENNSDSIVLEKAKKLRYQLKGQ